MIDKEFEERNQQNIEKMNEDTDLKNLTNSWFASSSKYEYPYHFSWLGRPIIQYPQDILAIQEIIWKIKPDLIIETGIARGGSLIFSASILELLGNGEVLGIDVDIREHNRIEIENHPLFKRITMLEGSSIDAKIIEKVSEIAKHNLKIMVFLDSNHTYEHVLQELNLYSPLVSKGSYLVVFDTIIEDLPENFNKEIVVRPWGKKNNPKTAVFDFLKKNNRFEIDLDIEKKLLITTNPSGYLYCKK